VLGRRAAARVGALMPAVDVDGPRVRVGVAWAVVSTIAIVIGPLTAAVVFGAVALAAAGQTCRSWRTSSTQPYMPVAVGGAVVCALAGAAGGVAVAAAVVATVVAAVAASQLRLGRQSWDAKATTAIALVVGVGAATPAVVRGHLGVVPAVVLLATLHVIDASTFIVGSGAASKWEGPVAGAAAALSSAIAVAAVLVPPFRGVAPWLLAITAAALVPAGAAVGSMLLAPPSPSAPSSSPASSSPASSSPPSSSAVADQTPRPRARRRGEAPVPALRRLDAWLVAGPVWALVASVVLDVRR